MSINCMVCVVNDRTGSDMLCDGCRAEERKGIAKMLHCEVDMLLPRNRVCGDCVHIQRCTALGVTTWARLYCDWSPSRFKYRQET